MRATRAVPANFATMIVNTPSVACPCEIKNSAISFNGKSNSAGVAKKRSAGYGGSPATKASTERRIGSRPMAAASRPRSSHSQSSITITIAASGWKDGERLGVNLGYLHDAARFAQSANLTIGITDENHPLKIADGAYLAIVMPLRLDKGEIP